MEGDEWWGGFVHFGEMLLSRTEGLTMMDGSVL